MKKFSCPYCQKRFPVLSALKDHQESQHPAELAVRTKKIARVLILGIIVIIPIAFIGYWAVKPRPNDLTSNIISSLKLPQPGDHWHASYNIRICAKDLAPFSDSVGGIHTHGDGLIHIHPRRASEAGRSANLANFFKSTNAKISASRLELPDGSIYQDGDRCPGDKFPSFVRTFVNGALIKNPAGYVPQDGDDIAIIFGPLLEDAPEVNDDKQSYHDGNKGPEDKY